MKFFGKKIIAFVVMFSMVVTLLAGCTKTETKETGDTDSQKTETQKEQTATQTNTPEKGREQVHFWYLWGGEEAKLIEQIIAEYNKSQDKYEVIGTSTPDQQVIITAISGGQGPDISDDFGGSVPKYANEGIAESLEEYIKRDNFDTSVFVKAALEQQRYEGKLHALPISVNVFALFYNKDLLEKAGIKELPKTLEELMEASEKATVSENGVMSQLGAPFIPAAFWPTTFTYANGSDFGTVGDLKPDNEGFRKSLVYLESQVKKFGKDAMSNFVTSGNANLYTPQDPFLNGTQVFRIDGPWFYNMAKDAGIHFDMMPMPGAEALKADGWSTIDTSMLYIPSTAKNKDGAWDFMKYMCVGEGNKLFCTLKGDLPPTANLLSDPEFAVKESSKVFLEIIAKDKLRSLPSFLNTAEYSKAIRNAVENILLGDPVDKSIEEMKKAVEAIK